jgi:hypothetical protein
MASGTEIFRLFGSILIDSTEAEKSLSKVGEGATDVVTNLGKGVVKAAEWAAAVGAAAVTAATALVTSTASTADNIDKMSQKIGISTDSYQEWSYIMEHCGTSVDNLQSGMKTLSSAVENSSTSSVEAFEALGLSMEEVSAMSQEDLFSAVISGLQGMESGTERTTIATTLLGKSATDMGALLNTSAEDTEAMRQAVHDLGGVMSEDAVAAGAAFEDALTDLKTAASGVSNNLAGEFLPDVTEVMNGIVQVISGDEGGLTTIKNGIRSMLDKLNEMIPDLLEIGTDMMLEFVDVIIDNLPQIIEMGVTIILKLIVGLVQALPDLVAKIPDIISAIVNGFASAWPDIQGIGSDIIDYIIDGITGAASRLWTKVSSIASEAVSKIKSVFSISSGDDSSTASAGTSSGTSGTSSSSSSGGTTVNQYIYSTAQTAADLELEAKWEQDRETRLAW